MFERIILELLHRLEAIGDIHEELYDSEVREAMDRVVDDGFLKPIAGYALPGSFGMYSEEGNRLVVEALAWFLPAAIEASSVEGFDTFKIRLRAFQNPEIRNARHHDYNDFFG